MNKIVFFSFVYMMIGFLGAGPVLANAALLPGTACPAAGRVVQTGGAETGGSGNMMVCEGGVWKAFMSFDGSGQITRIGHQSCSSGQVLSYNGSRWVCSSKGELQCQTVSASHCPAGYIKTGNTPDLLLGLGSYPVCCRIQ